MRARIITNDDVKIKSELINEIVKQDLMCYELGCKNTYFKIWNVDTYSQMSIDQLKQLIIINGKFILNLMRMKGDK